MCRSIAKLESQFKPTHGVEAVSTPWLRSHSLSAAAHRSIRILPEHDDALHFRDAFKSVSPTPMPQKLCPTVHMQHKNIQPSPSIIAQPVEATEAASSTETPSATELETAPIPPINGSQATPLSTSLSVDTSAGTSLNSRPRPPQPPPPRHQHQRRHQTPYQRREHTQHLKQLRKEEAGAAAAAARRKSGLLNESSQAPPLLITQIAGRQVPATTREAVAINLEARQKIENPPRQQRQQQAKLKRKQKLQSPQTCHEESPPSPPTPAFRFVTEAHKQQLGRAGGKRGQREQANGGGVSDSVVHADIDLAAAAASAEVAGVPAWGMVDGGDAVPRKAAGLTSGCSSGAGVPDAGAGPDVAKAAIRPAWEVVESGDVEAAAGRGRRKPLFFLKPTAPAMTKMPPPRLDFNEQIELFTKKRQLLDVANVWEVSQSVCQSSRQAGLPDMKCGVLVYTYI